MPDGGPGNAELRTEVVFRRQQVTRLKSAVNDLLSQNFIKLRYWGIDAFMKK